MDYYEGDNIGSLKTIEIIRHDWPIAWHPVALPEAVEWINIPLKEESGIMTIKTEETDNGVIYTYAGSFFIAHLRDEVDQVLMPFCGKSESILRLTDMNDRVYIVGMPDCPAKINLSATTGQKYVNENGTAFNFSVEQIVPAISA